MLVALFLLTSIFGFAQPPSYCNQASVHHVRTQIDPNRDGGFSFAYQYFLPKHPGGPVVVVIPGGPGGTSIHPGAPRDRAENGWIYIDPRGVGCNDNLAIPDSSLSSRNIAADILATLSQEKISNYTLFGTSYGTVVATIAASMTEAKGLPRPQALLLEGTLGRAPTRAEAYEAYEKRWSKILASLPLGIQAQFAEADPPLGLSERQWGIWLESQLLGGLHGGREPIADQLIAAFSGESGKESLEREIIGVSNVATPPAVERLYRAVTCRELYKAAGVTADFRLVRGELVPLDGDICEGIALDAVYDSSRYKIHVPIYYFVGGLDPATPPWQALHHAAVQNETERHLLVSKDGGHGVDTLQDCIGRILNAILYKEAGLNRAVDSCKAKPELLNYIAKVGSPRHGNSSGREGHE